MTLKRAFLLGHLPLAMVWAIAFFWIGAPPEDIGSVVSVAFVCSLPGMAFPFVWRTNRLLGRVFGVCTYAVTVPFFLGWPEDPLVITLSGLGLTIIGSVAAVPISVLPVLRAGRSSSYDKAAASEPVEVTADMPLIKERFSDLQKLLRVEGDKVQTSLESALGEVEEQNEQLQALRIEEQRLNAELETYRSLAEISEGQAKALQVMLRKGKYVDYGIGFFLGLLSSAAVAASSYFLGGVAGP